MLNTLTPNAFLAPHDPALPGLHLSAPHCMLELLREKLVSVPIETRARWQSCSVQEAIYQPGKSCRIAYSVDVDKPARPQLLYARWTVNRAFQASADLVQLDGADFEIYRFPRDRRMRHIRSMRRGEWLRCHSQAWFEDWLGPGQFAPDGWRCTPTKYVPESRLVCRLKGRWLGREQDQWKRAYVRIARRCDARAQFEVASCLQAQISQKRLSFSVPRPLGFVADKHLFATEFIRGRTLYEAAGSLGADFVQETVGRIASLGCCVLAQRASALSPFGGFSGPSAMLRAIARAIPDTTWLVDALRDWANQRPEAPACWSWVHGDLHAKQVLIKGDRVCIVDWDQAGPGDGTRDITNLAAEFVAQSNPALAERCVRAWRDGGGAWAASTATWWATRALVLRAWGTLRHLRPGWQDQTPNLLRQAMETWRNNAEWLR